MKLRVNPKKIVEYIKVALVIMLVVIEAFVYAQAAGMYVGTKLLYSLIILGVCCIALAVLEAINAFKVTSFVAKMVFYGVDSALLLAICILTGNSFLAALYCIVLTQIYISIDRFRDKAVLFGVSCVLFTVSFIVGWVFTHENASIFNSVVEILSGALFGLLVLAIDFVIVQFLIKFYRTNVELSAALKEADESRAQLKEVYEELSKTAVYEERNRIAKDIHDNAGHSMTTVIMQTEAAKLLIDSDPEEAKSRIISANIQARNALEQMRESVHLLAGRNEVKSVKTELENIISQTIDGTDIKVRYDIAESEADEEVYRFLSNSLKECLANGIRHGKATAFYVEFRKDGERMSLFISDNGTGVQGDITPGFGLKTMMDKAAALGGRCTLRSEKDEGFEVKIVLPLKDCEAKEEL